MNTKKILAGIFSCLILLAASCTSDTEGDLYEDGVHKLHVGDQSSVNKQHLGDQSSVNKRHLGNQSSGK